jgi:hypothetical protein
MPAVRPTSYATWASGASGYVVEPTQTDKNLGMQPTGIARSSYVNWLWNNAGGWHQYLDQAVGAPFFGSTAVDGDLILGATTYVMSRNLTVGDLAIGPSSIFDTNGYIPLVRGVLTGVSGIIRCNGGNGSAGMSLSQQTPGFGNSGPLSGGNGGGTTGVLFGATRIGQSILNGLGGAGGAGSTGGGTNNQGAGGTAIGPSSYYGVAPAMFDGVVKWATFDPTTGQPLGPTYAYLRGGAGGGRGSNDSSQNGGGGGGAGAGVVLMPCREVNFVGTVQVRGGDGGAGGGTGSGGGGGGGGGAFVVPYVKLTRLTVTVDARGGTGGAAAAAGASHFNGVAGTPGATAQIMIPIYGS